jgi:plastocyanin
MKTISGSISRIFTGVLILFTIITISGSCSKTMDNMTGTGGGKGGPGANEVWIQGMAFSPGIITITAGTTVTWTNKDAVPHTVTSTGNFDSGSIANGGTFSFTFNSAGTYPYICSFHPSMTATVKVN